jgi:hypothetical protein
MIQNGGTDMKKWVALILYLTFLLVLAGCGPSKSVSTEMALGEPLHEQWSGTITDIFTEGGGADQAAVIQV